MPDPRASDDDRERVVERLRDAVADGRIDLDEFEHRMSRAYAARTRGELVPLLVDLPHEHVRHQVTPTKDTIRVTLSSTQRGRGWAVPQRLEVRLTMASVTLDLTDTEIPDLAEIDVSATLSSLDVIVPPGVRVETRGVTAVLGSLNDRSRAVSVPRGARVPVVVITGRTVLGSITVKQRSALTQWWQGVLGRVPREQLGQ